jgi:hypothetical protein
MPAASTLAASPPSSFARQVWGGSMRLVSVFTLLAACFVFRPVALAQRVPLSNQMSAGPARDSLNSAILMCVSDRSDGLGL